jgi:hypothetical protein
MGGRGGWATPSQWGWSRATSRGRQGWRTVLNKFIFFFNKFIFFFIHMDTCRHLIDLT